jgi:hypothetical protein
MKRALVALFVLLACSFASGAAGDWKPLTSAEKTGVARELKKLKIGMITIACAGTWCKVFSDDVAALFKDAGWHVTLLHHGGLGIDGVAGIRIDSCNLAKGQILDVLRELETRDVSVVMDDPSCGDEEIHMVVGTPSEK